MHDLHALVLYKLNKYRGANNMLKNAIKRLKKDERGATIVEYALVVALIAVASIFMLAAFQDNLTTTFTNLGTSISVQKGTDQDKVDN